MFKTIIKILFCLCVLIFLLVTAVEVESSGLVAILKSADAPDFNAVRNGFISVFFGEYDEFDCANDLNRARRQLSAIKADDYDVILAIGDIAMSVAASEAADLRVIGTMIPNPDNYSSVSDNISIIGMYPDTSVFFQRLRQANIRNLGVLYNPDENLQHVERLRAGASAGNINMIDMEVSSPRVVPTAFQQIMGEIDGFLFLTDSIYSIRDSIDFIIQLSSQNKIITVAPTSALVAQGAILSISVDLVEIGRLAANLINDHYAGESLPAFTDARSLHISYNDRVARDAGITIPAELQREANEVIR